MPNLPISGLPASSTLDGNELFADVQGGVTKYTTLNDIADYVTSSFEYITPSQTSSFVTNADTGSLMVTGSLLGTTLTFEKGNSSTFDINLAGTFITSSQTGSFQKTAYLSIYSTSSQALIASGSEQVVTFTSTWASEGITLQEGSKIVMEKAGVYQFNFVAQVTNLENAVYDSWFWIKYNGNNFPNSTTLMSLNPRKNSSIPSSQLMTTSIIGVALNDNDYIQLYWTGEDLATSITETPAIGPIPETPSIIANIHRVG